MNRVFRSVRMWVAAAVAAAALGLVFTGVGCDTTESTPASKATVDLNPGGHYTVTSFSWLNAPTNAAAGGEGEENGEENEGPAAPTALSVAGSPRDGGGWDLTFTTDGGASYSAVADAGAAVKPTGNDKTYTVGSRVAEYALSGAGVSGQITVFATAPIAMSIRRATNNAASSGAATTNSAPVNEAVGMHGVHTISPDNARYELDATLQGLSATLKAKASAASGEITW